MIDHDQEDDDPIVAEVRQARAAIFAKYNNDLRAYAATLQAKTEEARLAGRKVVSLPPRRPDGWTESTKKAG
jgi:hypothetical protein